MQESLHEIAKAVTNDVGAFASRIDVDSLPFDQKERIEQLKRLTADVRLDCRDYQYAQTRQEQLTSAAEAKQRLEQLNKLLLELSEHTIFSPADIAYFSAKIQQLRALLT
ncbi:MAG TPA: hypothetical protein VFI74_02920 [Candidatus Saccharimonadales bacterium]|nr:hypothetical protein [Candidatus Saccharimonadales bacterium]